MYEATSTAVETALNASSPAVFTSSTIDKILALTTGPGDTTTRIDQVVPDASGNVTVAAGAEIVMIDSSDTTVTTLTVPNAPVIIFQGQGGVIATIGDGASTVTSGYGVTDRVVVGTAAADMITIVGSQNSLVTIGDGDTVVAGAGADTVVAGGGDTTVQGGTGYAIVQLTGSASDYVVTVVDGNAVVTGGNSTTNISGIQFVQLDNGEALIFAQSESQAAVSTLYEALFGRAADSNGLDYWFDVADAGASLDQIANAFINSAEYQALGTKTDGEFINSVYLNTFSRAATTLEIAEWTLALVNGSNRADILEGVALNAADNISGDLNTEATIVGSVSIITTII
jgi:hypothetical protein